MVVRVSGFNASYDRVDGRFSRFSPPIGSDVTRDPELGRRHRGISTMQYEIGAMLRKKKSHAQGVYFRRFRARKSNVNKVIMFDSKKSM